MQLFSKKINKSTYMQLYIHVGNPGDNSQQYSLEGIWISLFCLVCSPSLTDCQGKFQINIFCGWNILNLRSQHINNSWIKTRRSIF
jgi:hypothetical protein